MSTAGLSWGEVEQGRDAVRATFSLGRIAGVRIGVHWSVLLIFGLIAFGLAQGHFPHVYPGHTPLVYWAAGLGTAVVFFASLVGHRPARVAVRPVRPVAP